MESDISSQIIKMILMMALVISVFIIIAYVVKNKYIGVAHNDLAKLIKQSHINNKEKVLYLQCQDYAYIIFSSVNGVVLLDKHTYEIDQDQDVVGLDQRFDKIMQGLFKK